MSFGKRIKELRENKGHTQREVANLLSMSNSTLAMYETDKRQPDLAATARLADFFGVTTDYLIGRNISAAKSEPTSPQFSADELALIEKYRQMKDDGKDTMHKVANHISPDEQAAAAGK